jgi:hypothetical protein
VHTKVAIVNSSLKQTLSHVFWIGGPANSGKTTIASIIAWKKRFQRYSYDKNAMDHLERLAVASGSQWLTPTESQDDSWVNVLSGSTVSQTLKYFENRFPLVLEDLHAIPTDKPILAEGIGFTPDLIHPYLSSPAQAIWLIPEAKFMEKTLRQKIKPPLTHLMKHAHRTLEALIIRDMQMVEIVTEQVKAYSLKMIVIDGSVSKQDIAIQVMNHFEQHTI